MKKLSTKSLRLLFPHHEDPAFEKLEGLEEIAAEIVSRNLTAPFKQRLQRSIAKLSDALVDYADNDGLAGRDRFAVRGLLNCRKAASAIQLLYRGRAITTDVRSAAFELLADIAQLMIERIHSLLGLPAPGLLRRPDLDRMDRDRTPPQSEIPPAAA